MRPSRPLSAVLLIAGASLLWGPFTADAANYYVSKDGDDADAGSSAQPWRTIQHAADRLAAGDAVFVRAGTYNESVTLTKSGSRSNPITFAVAAGERVVIDGSGIDGSGFQTSFSEPDPRPSNIVIKGFEIRGFKDFGIVAWSVNDHLQLKDLNIHDNGDAAIRLSNSDGTRVEGVTMEGNIAGFDCTPVLPGRESDPGCTDLVIKSSTASRNGSGNDTAVDAFAVERGTSILVEDTTASYGPGDCFDFKSSQTTLSRTVSLGCTRNGTKLWGRGTKLVNSISAGHGLEGLVLAAGGSYTIVNNVIANTTAYGYTATVGDGPGDVPVTLRNNIFANAVPENEGTLLYVSAGTKLTADHNLLYDPYRTDCVIDAAYGPGCLASTDIERAWAGVTGQGAGSIYRNPKFNDPLTNFRPASDSPAIDAGSSEGAPATDIECKPRPQGRAVDIGPYESGDASRNCGKSPIGTNRISKLRFRALKSGRRLEARFKLASAARVQVSVARRGKTALRKSRSASAGKNRFVFAFNGRRGRYTGKVKVSGSNISKKKRFVL